MLYMISYNIPQTGKSETTRSVEHLQQLSASIIKKYTITIIKCTSKRSGKKTNLLNPTPTQSVGLQQ